MRRPLFESHIASAEASAFTRRQRAYPPLVLFFREGIGIPAPTSTSAPIPRLSVSRRIIAKVRGLLPLSTSLARARVSTLSDSEKIGEAMRRALPLLPASARQQIERILTPEALAVVAGVLVVL